MATNVATTSLTLLSAIKWYQTRLELPNYRIKSSRRLHGSVGWRGLVAVQHCELDKAHRAIIRQARSLLFRMTEQPPWPSHAASIELQADKSGSAGTCMLTSTPSSRHAAAALEPWLLDRGARLGPVAVTRLGPV